MKGYKRILVATDLSADSKKILKKAQSLAELYQAEIYLVHVLEYSPFTYADDFTIPLDPSLESGLERQARQIVEQMATKFEIAPDRCHVSEGSVRQIVVEYADKIKADLIIVGSHSFGAFGRLLGSRANAILHHANCDVWIFKQQPKDD